MARFTQGGGSGDGSALNFVQNKVAQPVSVTGYPTTIAAVTITTTGKPVQISLTGEGSNAQAGSWVRLNVFRDGEAIGNTIQIEASAVSENVPYAINVIDEVGSGQHVYEAIIISMSAGNWSFGEASGPIMNAVELTGFKGDTGEQGPQGEPGAQGEAGTDATGGVVYLGDYVLGNGYLADIAVVRGSDNNLYIAKSNGGLADPVGNTAEWDIFSDNTAGGPSGDLVIPFVIKDENGNDLLGFEKGGTGVTRINALQDDLALRSSNDIILYPGDDGPGSVYIGWGDANYTPDATNRVATIADIQAATGLGDFVFTAGTATVNDDEILSIQANNPDTVKSQLVLHPDGGAKLQAFDNPNVVGFYASNPDWDSATWAIEPGIGSVINFINAPNILNWIATSSLSVYNASMVINGIPAGTVNGFSYNGTDATLYINTTVPTEDPTVNEIGFSFVTSSFIDINYDNGVFDIQANNMDVNIRSDDDIYITAGGDDLFLRANDDIRFVSNYQNGGTEYNWRMNSEGRLTLPNDGYIDNVTNSSGDGAGNPTLHISPTSYLGTDQYLIVDPTSPNHIHIRAGGTQDESSAHIIVGGEKTNVEVSDVYRNVQIHSRPPQVINSYTNQSDTSDSNFVTAMPADIDTGYIVNVGGTDYTVSGTILNYPLEGLIQVTVPEATFDVDGSYTFRFEPFWNNTWNFASNGTLYGPAQGYIPVSGLTNDPDFDFTVTSNRAITLSADNGEFLNDPTVPSNQIATIGNLNDTVSTGMVRYSPTFAATGLAFTGSDTTYPTYNSYYAKSGKMVSFVIEVDCSTVTNFGTGQFKLQLPFTPAVGFNHFTGWCWADPNVDPDTGTGHTIINADTAGITNVLDLHYLKSAGGANAAIREGLLVQGTPVTLSTISKIYVNGTYISQ